MTCLSTWCLPLRALVCLQLLGVVTRPVSADTVSWEGDINDRWHVGDNWSTNLSCGPVICHQVPPQPDDDVFVVDSTNGSSVFMNADEVIQSLHIGFGMTVHTNGHHLNAGGGTPSGDRLLIHGTGSTLRVSDAGSPANDLYTNGFQLTGGGSLRLHGSPQVEHEGQGGASRIESSSSLYGNGTVRFNYPGGGGTLLQNEGAIIVRGGDLTLTAGNSVLLDLDGQSGAGLIDVDDFDNVASRNLKLTVDGPLSDAFDGTLRIGKGDEVHFTRPWSLTSGVSGLLEMNARDATAILSGADLTLAGNLARIEVQSGTARFEANLDVDLGTLAISDNTTVDFAGDAVFSANATIDKSSAVGHEMIVRGHVSINQPVFDWDGQGIANHVTSIVGGALTIDSDRIDVLDNRFDGTLNIIGEPARQARLGVVPSPWFMNGTMHLDGTSGIASVIRSSDAVMHIGNGQDSDATLLVDGSSPFISSGVEFEDDARVTLNAGSRLRLIGLAGLDNTAKIADGAQFSGPGELYNDNNEIVVEHGATLGVRLVNAGVLTTDGPTGFGAMGVAEFEQTLTGQLNIKLGNAALGISDRLHVTTSAELDGAVSVTSSAPLPNRGDELTILTAASISGEFANVTLPPAAVGDTWRLIYEPDSVILRVTTSGDFNLDGNFDCLDVDALVFEIAAASNNLDFDLTGDGSLDGMDLAQWLTDAGAANLPSSNAYLPGDASLDGFVDGGDFVVWNAHKFTANAAWCSGDFNADGFVDGGDFVVWNAHKFTGALAQLGNRPGQLSAVPEPAGCLLLLAGMLAGLRSRRHSKW